MNSDYEKKLEARVQRELSALGDLPAPTALTTRILSQIESRTAAPWYRRPWPTWPVGLQSAFVLLLVALLGGLCLAGTEAWQMVGQSATGQQLARWFSGVGAIWDSAGTLVAALNLVISQIHPGFILGFVGLLLFAAVTCAGASTALVRFALARK